MVRFHQWCPVAFTQLVTILPKDLHDVYKLRISTGAHWPYLADVDLKVQRAFEIEEYTDPHHQATVPHTLVVTPGLVVDKVYVGYWFWGRPTPFQLWEDLQDYGGPIGFRLALAHPDRVQALIVQNAVAHEDGLGPLWETRRQFWAHRSEHETTLRENFFSPAATRQRHIGTSPTPENYDPDLWTDELAFLRRPGQADIQTDLFFDYQTNVASYPAWQQWLRAHQPPLLVTWGRYDPSFEAAEAAAYKRDVPGAKVHLLDGGHFALDEQAGQIADLTRNFLVTKLGSSPAA